MTGPKTLPRSPAAPPSRRAVLGALVSLVRAATTAAAPAETPPTPRTVGNRSP